MGSKRCSNEIKGWYFSVSDTQLVVVSDQTRSQQIATLKGLGILIWVCMDLATCSVFIMKTLTSDCQKAEFYNKVKQYGQEMQEQLILRL